MNEKYKGVVNHQRTHQRDAAHQTNGRYFDAGDRFRVEYSGPVDHRSDGGNMRIGTFGALGAFAFLSFQPFTPTKLAKRILKAGLAIMAGFLAEFAFHTRSLDDTDNDQSVS